MFLRLAAIWATCLVVCGCSTMPPQQEAESEDAVETAANAAVEKCNDTYKEGIRAVAVDRAKCLNTALAKLRPLKRFPDLLDAEAANRLALATKEQKGGVSHIDAMQQFAALRAKNIADEQRRTSGNPSVGGPTLSATAMPTACTRYGDTVTCY